MTLRVLCCIAFSFAAVHNASSQGTTTFANSLATVVTDHHNGEPLQPGVFRVALYYLPWFSDAVVPSARDFDEDPKIAGTSAIFAPGFYHNDGHPANAAEITPSGGFGWFQVRAWEVAYGGTYAEAAKNPHAMVGFSNVVKVDTGDPTSAPPGLPGNLFLAGIRGFSVDHAQVIDSSETFHVPEPSMVGLLSIIAMCLVVGHGESHMDPDCGTSRGQDLDSQ